MKGNIDNYLVELDCLFEKGLIIGESSNIAFEKIIIGADNNPLYSPMKFKRTYGTIIAVPQALSERVYDDAGGVKMTVRDTYSDLLEVGDTAHFYWIATQPDMLLLQERFYGELDANGNIRMRYVFMIPADKVICSTNSRGKITMNGDYMLVKPIMQSEDEIKTPSGIWLSEETQPKPLLGTVVHANNLRSGTKIIYARNSDIEVEILGEKYYAMRDPMAMCQVEDEEVIPLGKRILLKEPLTKKYYDSGLEIPECFRKPEKRAVVDFTGQACTEVSKGDEVLLESHPMFFEYKGENYWTTHESSILAKIISNDAGKCQFNMEVLEVNRNRFIDDTKNLNIPPIA